MMNPNRRSLLVIASCLAVFVLLAPGAAVVQAQDEADLRRHIEELAQRLDRLEARVARLEAMIAPSAPPAPPAAPPGRHVLLLDNCVSRRTLEYGIRLGAERAVGFYQVSFVDRDEGRIDFDRLEAVIKRKIPEPDAELFAMLDIEWPFFGWLEKASGRDFARAQAQLIAAVRLAKTLRPNVKWSLYGVPRLPRFPRDDAGKKQAWCEASSASRQAAIDVARAPSDLHAELDWFCPAVYDQYLNANHHEWIGHAQREWAKAVVQLADDIAGDRPTITIVTHRVLNEFQPYNRGLIPIRELVSDQVAIGVEEGDGVIFWNGDHYYWKTEKLLQKDQPEEFASITTERQFWDHTDAVHGSRIKAMVEAVGVKPRR